MLPCQQQVSPWNNCHVQTTPLPHLAVFRAGILFILFAGKDQPRLATGVLVLGTDRLCTQKLTGAMWPGRQKTSPE